MPNAFAEPGRGVRAARERTTTTCRTSSSPSRTARSGCCRRARASARRKPSLRIAVDLAEEGVITKPEAVLRVNAASLDQLLHPTLDPDAKKDVLTTRPARFARRRLGRDRLHRRRRGGRAHARPRGHPRAPRDEPRGHPRHARRRGILTARGGMTSHAAVVARGMGRPCVSGAGALRIDAKAGTHAGRRARSAEGRRHHHRRQHRAGDGRRARCASRSCRARSPAHGLGRRGAPPARARQRRHPARRASGARVRRRGHRPVPHRAHVLRRRAHPRRARDDPRRRRRRAPRRARQDPADAARRFRAALRDHGRAAGDHSAARSAAARVPAANADEIPAVAAELGVPPESCRRASTQLPEFNPMLGFRGCRLAILYPEIVEMQARAIFEAAVAAEKKTGQPVKPEIMVPLVAFRRSSRSCATSSCEPPRPCRRRPSTSSTSSSAR